MITKWIPNSLTLTGQTVSLLSLQKSHFPELENLARDKRIWEHYAYDGSNPLKLREVLESGLSDQKKGTQTPFVIFHHADGKLIGSTRFIDVQAKHRKLEIGTTWVHPEYWATPVNPECKLLLLTYCFETLGAIRVQLKTDANNVRSRKAIEKIGGQFEGILRNDIIRDNNTKRSSAYYSILEEEWPVKKQKLISLLQNKMELTHNKSGLHKAS